MTNAYKVAILAGDAIGPEIMTQAVRVFDVLSQHRDVAFELIDAPFGASAYFEHGKAFPEQTKQICDEADAILKGPVGLSHEEKPKILSRNKLSVAQFCHSELATTPLLTSGLFF